MCRLATGAGPVSVSTLPSLPQAELKALRTLKTRGERERQGLFLAEGDHLTGESIQEGKALRLLVAAGQEQRYARHLDSGIASFTISEKSLAMLCDTRTPQGVMAVCALPPEPGLAALGPRMVALNGVQDPGNVGTILRTMDAAGFTGMLMDTACADAFSPKALRASMGAAFRIPVRVTDDLPQDLGLLEGYVLLAAALDGTPFYQRSPVGPRLCVLIGSEGAGLAPEVAAMATQRLRLPMPGRAESLNAAVAASIIIYDLLREQQAREQTPDR